MTEIELQKIQDTFPTEVTREEFESFIAEVESFRDTILDEFANIKQDMEKLKYHLEIIEDALKEKNIKLGQRKL